MSVVNYKFGPWWADEDPFDSVKKKAKRRDNELARKEIEEALWEMENEDDD